MAMTTASAKTTAEARSISTGRLLLVGRLAVRDLRRRPIEAALLLLAMLAATTTLTLGLVLRDAAADPYESTRQATNGPDVVAEAGHAEDLSGLVEAAGVTDHSGPYPVAAAKFQASGRTSDVQAVGRDATSASVDQPRVLRGSWVSDGGVVVEDAFAAAFQVRVGDRVTLGGRAFRVVGIAVTAAQSPYPRATCIVFAPGCMTGAPPGSVDVPAGLLQDPGLVWLTRADAQRLASVSYLVNLKLADPAEAEAFVGAREGSGPMQDWPSIRADATSLAGDAQILLLIGAWLLGLLAIASLSVLVGGRMADQTRRVGLLKAVGGTPGLVAAVLLAEYLFVAVIAAAAGLAIGSLTAPLLTGSGAGSPSMTWPTVAWVISAAAGVAIAATLFPALRASRVSTLDALADAARPARRTGWLIAISARLPIPLLLALRVAARRPRRAVLAVVSIAITISGIYVALVLDAYLARPGAGGYEAAQTELLRQVLLVVMVVLAVLAAVNAVVITWATVLDNRHSSALARALGATPREVSAGLAAAQVLPALAGAVLGIFPGGFVLFAAIMGITGGDRHRATLPPLGQQLVVVLVTLLVVAALTALPAGLAGRRPVAETFQAA